MKTPSNLSLPCGPDRWQKQRVLFCGHAGWFYADVILTPFAAVVRAPKAVHPGNIYRLNLQMAEWHISDRNGGYWNPTDGLFVLPRESITRITAANLNTFI